MKQYTLEYKNIGTTRVISTVCANNLEELQKMISEGSLTFNAEIEDIQFDNPEGEYTILEEKDTHTDKIDPIIYDSQYEFMNPPQPA